MSTASCPVIGCWITGPHSHEATTAGPAMYYSGEVSVSSARDLLDDLWADADDVVRRHLSDQQKLNQAYRLAGRIEKVILLHSVGDVGAPPSALPRCASCRVPWPCPTVRLLNGEDV